MANPSTSDFDVFREAMDTISLSEKGITFPIMRVDRPRETLKNRDDSVVTITVLGPDSTRWRQLNNAIVRKRLEEAQASTRANGADTQEQEAEESLGATIEMLAGCTIAWTFKRADNSDIPCDAQHVAALYRAFPAIRDQVDRKVSNRANFLPAPSSS